MEATCGYAECKRKIVRDNMCIFHLPNKKPEEAEEFNSYLRAEIERMQKDATIDRIDLSGFRFPRPTYKFPWGTRFEKEVNLSNVVFEGEADFCGCEFSYLATFDQAKFLGGVSFTRVKFWNDATFFESEFARIASFDKAEFEFAVFSDAKFLGEAVFSGARFAGPALFMGCKFFRTVSFEDTQFLDVANFDEIKFSGKAYFDRVQFLSDANFVESEFSDDASFYWSKVGGAMTFRSTIFQTTDDQILSSPIKQYTRFEAIKVDSRGEVRFEGGVCMSRVSLYYTDIRRFSFFDVKWGRIRGRASIMEHGILEKRERGPRDEEMVLPDITPEHVHQIYVRLRRNLERGAGRYPEAGDFFVKEKEMRKLILQERRRWPRLENLSEWFILKLYGWLALYGESIMRPIFWGMIAILGFTALRMVFFLLQPTDTKTYLDFLMESVMAFFQMRSEPGLDVLERLISVPILGSLFIALKRKFERR